jgi:lipopolysaccharide export system permease protein
MQHMLKYFDDLVGKDLGWDVLGKLLFYFAVFMTPVALPLAVLLSSLITFGNLGEHFELTAIKSAGISLLRTLQPIFFFVVGLTGVAFYINNNLVPKAALEAYSLLYDIKQKKPALDLREGAFYMGIPDISIKINKKFHDDAAALKGVVIYDHRKNEGNKQVTVADSGRMYTILNERYLKLELFNGYNYNEGTTSEHEMAGQRSRGGNNESLSRTKFQKTQMVFDLSSFQMQTTDKKWFQGNRIMRNLSELTDDVDSIRNEVLSQKYEYYTNRTSFFSYFRREEPTKYPEEVLKYRKMKDSLNQSFYTNRYNTQPSTPPTPQAQGLKPVPVEKIAPASASKSVTKVTEDKAALKRKQEIARKKKMNERIAANKARIAAYKKAAIKKRPTPKPVVKKKIEIKPVVPAKKINLDSLITHRIDSIFNLKATTDNYQNAANAARQAKGQLQNSNNNVESYVSEMRVFEIQWHKIIANSMACIAMFLIGAPLGSIIKKGGLGVPFLVSILFFIVYYVMNMMGEKWAKAGTVDVFTGVWGADFILFIVGIMFLRQARADARLFDADSYLVGIDKLKRRWKGRKGVIVTPVKA